MVGYTYDPKRIHFLQKLVSITQESVYIDIDHAEMSYFDRFFQELCEPIMGNSISSKIN